MGEMLHQLKVLLKYCKLKDLVVQGFLHQQGLGFRAGSGSQLLVAWVVTSYVLDSMVPAGKSSLIS